TGTDLNGTRVTGWNEEDCVYRYIYRHHILGYRNVCGSGRVFPFTTLILQGNTRLDKEIVCYTEVAEAGYAKTTLSLA
ncbi:hypothetical protein NL463_27975, partial [Klebsiella pneumoniae]|nr:hypothetical protein [Klebsiella pneumoniae]